MFQRSHDFTSDESVAPRSLPRLPRNTHLFVRRDEQSRERLIRKSDPDPAGHQLVSELAAAWSTVQADSIDDAIIVGLKRIATALAMDHAALWWRTSEADGLSSLRWNSYAAPSPALIDTATTNFVTSALTAGRPASFARLDELSEVDRAELSGIGLRSLAVVPIVVTPTMSGALGVGSSGCEREWNPELLHQVQVIGALGAQLLARRFGASALEAAHAEIRQLRDRLAEERGSSRPAARAVRLPRPLVSDGTAIQQVLAQVEQVAPTPATVLLLGETGVGKEVIAQAIHDSSPRHMRPMIRVSCGAIPTALIESELFGRERGAYTGALTRQIGRFEAAQGSTIFLDEIGELSTEVQVKLLRVLQERVIERLGSTQSIKVDVRIIAATNRNLDKAVADKLFRDDLYYRLNVFPITVPPLRERVEDIHALAWEFVDEFSKSFGRKIDSIDKSSIEQLERYAWPGNVRELRNVIERAVIVATGPQLSVPVPRPLTATARPTSSLTLRDLEVEHIRETLDATNWRVRGRRGAAERLGLKPTTLEGRMAKLGLARPAVTHP